MWLGFVLIGMIFGMIAALAVLVSGAGLVMAALTYVGCGLLGVCLGLAVALWPRPRKKPDQASATRVNALHNPK